MNDLSGRVGYTRLIPGCLDIELSLISLIIELLITMLCGVATNFLT